MYITRPFKTYISLTILHYATESVSDLLSLDYSLNVIIVERLEVLSCRAVHYA